MSRFNPAAVKNFQERLSEFERSQQATLSAKDVVSQSMKAIDKARQHGASWDAIAQMLMQSLCDQGSDFKISGRTVQAYYYSIRKENQENSSSRKDKAKTSKRQLKGKKQPNAVAESIPHPLDVTHLSQTDVVEDSPIKQSPIVAERTDSNGSFSHWKEPEFNVNRVRPPVTGASQN